MSRRERRAVRLLERFWMHSAQSLARKGVEWAVQKHRNVMARTIQCAARAWIARRAVAGIRFAGAKLTRWARWTLVRRKDAKKMLRAHKFRWKKLVQGSLDRLAAHCEQTLSERHQPSTVRRNRRCRLIGSRLRLSLAWMSLQRWWRTRVSSSRQAMRALEFFDSNELRSRFRRWKRCARQARVTRVTLSKIFLHTVPVRTRNCSFHRSRADRVENMYRQSLKKRWLCRLARAAALARTRKLRAIGMHKRLGMLSSATQRAFDGLRQGIQIESRQLWLEQEAEKTGAKRRKRRVFRAIRSLVHRSLADRKKFLMSVSFSHRLLKKHAFQSIVGFARDVRIRRRQAAAMLVNSEKGLMLRCMLAMRATVAFQRHQQKIFHRAARLQRMQLCRRSFRRILRFNGQERKSVGGMVRWLQRSALRIGFAELRDGVQIAQQQFLEKLQGAERLHSSATQLQSWWRGRRSVMSVYRKLANLRRIAGMVEEAWHSRGLRRAARRIAGLAKTELFWRHERERLQLEQCEVESRRLERWVGAANRIAVGYLDYRKRVVAWQFRQAQRLQAKKDRLERQAQEKAAALRQQEKIREFHRRAPAAVERINAAWRGYAERELRQTLRILKLQQWSAIRIQRNYRRRLARYRAEAILRMRDDQLRRQARLQQEAAAARTLGYRHRLEQGEFLEGLNAFPWFMSLSDIMVVPELSLQGALDGFLGLFGCRPARQSRAVFAGYDHKRLHRVAI